MSRVNLQIYIHPSIALGHLTSIVHPLHRNKRRPYTRAVARRRLKLIFGPSLVKEPVIYQVGRKFEIVTNIRRADVTRDQGWVLLEVSGEPEELDRGVEYMESRGVKVEPAEGDLVE